MRKKPTNKIICVVGMAGSGKSEVSDELVRGGQGVRLRKD